MGQKAFFYVSSWTGSSKVRATGLHPVGRVRVLSVHYFSSFSSTNPLFIMRHIISILVENKFGVSAHRGHVQRSWI